MATVSDAVLAMCDLFENGQIVDHVSEHAEQVANVKAALGELQNAALRERFTVYASKWTASAIQADPSGFYDATQVLAAELGNAGLL